MELFQGKYLFININKNDAEL